MGEQKQDKNEKYLFRYKVLLNNTKVIAENGVTLPYNEIYPFLKDLSMHYARNVTEDNEVAAIVENEPVLLREVKGFLGHDNSDPTDSKTRKIRMKGRNFIRAFIALDDQNITAYKCLYEEDFKDG